jgi:hypothetical protein
MSHHYMPTIYFPDQGVQQTKSYTIQVKIFYKL